MLVTEDWFVVSHFLPLLRALVGLDLEVTVATRCVDKRHVIEAAGVRVEPFDFRRQAIGPWANLGAVAGLRRLIGALAPDVVHAVAMKPIMLGGLMATAGMGKRLVIHLTGVGLAGTEATLPRKIVTNVSTALIRQRLKSPRTRLLIENPDDRARFAGPSDAAFDRITLLGGAGIDTEVYTSLPEPAADRIRVAFVGRLVWTKGVDVLVEAHRLLREAGVPIDLDICGVPDPMNPRPVDAGTLQAWTAAPGVRWRGFEKDVRQVWQEAHIAAVPSRGGEGLPRALLEAAACGRPLVVTDVPGCRHFVRDGIEGLIVPPGDPVALAGALRRLAGEPEARRRMGTAARTRILEGFTEQQVEKAIRCTYKDLLGI